MTKSIFIQSRSLGWVDNGSYFPALVGNSITSAASAIQAEVPIRTAGTFRNLYAYAPTNTATVNSTLTLQKSTVDTALTITYTADQTGVKEDNANSVAFANDDEGNWKLVVPGEAGTNTLTTTVISAEFSPDSGAAVTVMGATGSVGFTTQSTTQFVCANGQMTIGGTEARFSVAARVAFTVSNLWTHVSANARTTDVVIRTRVNTADGGQSVTYTSGQTGVKEDTSGTDSLVADDDFNYSFTTGTGTETITTKTICSTFTNSSGVFQFFAGHSSGTTVGPTVVTYAAIGGGLQSLSTTEADEQILPRFDLTLSELQVYVATNTNAALACDIAVRDDGGTSAMTVSYAAAQTGLKLDSVNTATITGGADEINYIITNNDLAGTVTVNSLGVLARDNSGGTFQPVMHRQQGTPFMAGYNDRPRSWNPF